MAIVFSVNSLDNTQPTTQQYEGHYDYRHADIMSLNYLLSDIKWEELLSDSPTINDMLTTFLDTFFSVCSKCVPTNRRHNGNSVKYPNHIAKLRRKCISLSKGKHLPNGMLNWRAANNEYMLQSCNVRKACSRHASSRQAVGIACTAIHITLLLHNLLIIQRFINDRECAILQSGDSSAFFKIDNKRFVDTVYIDFAKAFDTVSHAKLLHKLPKYGITGNILKWFASFLNGRKQRVKIGQSCSDYTNVASGVPQGSCTGAPCYSSCILMICLITI